MNRILIQFNLLGPGATSASDIISDNYKRKILADFLGIRVEDIADEITQRYVEVTPVEHYRQMTPAYDKLRIRIVEPLRIAKKSYCFGEYVTSIALSGIVGEMIAHVLYQINDPSANAHSIHDFGELGQKKRIKRLSELKFVSADQNKMLSYLQETRRPYMHWWDLERSADEIKNDAKEAVIRATELFFSVFDIGFASASSVSVDLKLKAFLDKVEKSVGPFYNSKY